MRSVVLIFALAAAAASCAANPINNQGTGGASSGGTTSKGGAPGTGGKTGSGGTTSTGGSSTSTVIDCPDTSAYTKSVTGQYGVTTITADNNSTKSYFMQANWWGSPYNNQTESVQGLGFTIANPNNTVASSNPSNPLGFPSLFIGTYGPNRTTGSNLPKAVSSLTSVPTIFSTNVDSMGATSYNATYDVWFTASSAVVTGSSPGPGGAYLMVWQFMPTDKRPRGSVVAGGSVVTGVKGGWDVWYDPSPSDNIPCVSYVSSSKISSLEFDLNYFIKDAIQSGYGVKSSQYLSIVFAGFEVWQGGDGLQLKKFCANVK
jgi:cellulose 1,4-beta-cellobiosidase